MEKCFSSFWDYLVQCTDVIQVYAQLQPATQYQWVITDKRENQYSGAFVTDANGFWDIAVTDLPAGFLTQYSGVFSLSVMGDGCTPVKFKIAQEFEAINFEIRGGTREKNTLGCDFTCMAPDGPPGSSAVFPFNDEDIVLIPWTNLLRSLYGDAVTADVYHETSPGVYQQVTGNVVVHMNGGPYFLDSIEVDNGGPATGYILVSK